MGLFSVLLGVASLVAVSTGCYSEGVLGGTYRSLMGYMCPKQCATTTSCKWAVTSIAYT